ncbi:hypothetical protein [Novosphingobium fuchskuhlense]|nr:hypothetical protein [Novosphingobium fuchskuhlense]
MIHPPKAVSEFKPLLKSDMNQMTEDDLWLEAGRLMIARHAQSHGYPAPEVNENTTDEGKRRLWWIDGSGAKMQWTGEKVAA